MVPIHIPKYDMELEKKKKKTYRLPLKSFDRVKRKRKKTDYTFGMCVPGDFV